MNDERFQTAVKALEAGDRASARRELIAFLGEESQHENAWFLLASAVDDPAQRRQCLENVLKANPHHEEARRQLAQLTGAAVPAPAPARQPPALPDGEMEVLKRVEARDGTFVEVLQYPLLEGSANLGTAQTLYYANRSGMRLKMVRITLSDSHVRVEPGALYFMRGRLELKASTGGGLIKGLARSLTSGETLFVSEIHGSGEVYLEPTFGHFLLHEVSAKEGGVIADRGLFFAGTAGLDISASAQKNISSALFGGEGLFQTSIQGSGIAVLYTPVPAREIKRFDLHQEKLWVDGNFALMRSHGIRFAAERAGRGWISSSASGEGLLQTFEGTGSVWIAPTQDVYEKLRTPAGLRALAVPPGASHTRTGDQS